MEGLDDLENNVAWQPDYDYENQVNASYSIEGSEKMLIGKEYVYVLDTNKNCDFAVDNENVEIVTLNAYTVTLKCDKPNEIFKLQALINDKENAYMSYDVATIYKEVPIDTNLENLTYQKVLKSK